jgi:hypothetical protein
MRPWKLGIIGCGGALLCIHLPVLQKLSNEFDIVAFYDVDTTRLDYLKKRLGGAKACYDLQELLASEVDVIVILSHNHESFIESALKAGKHVFTEKPLSLDLKLSQTLKDLAISRNLILEVGLMRLYDKVIQEFFNQISPSHILSAVFYKSDGSDAIIRQSLMPESLSIYNFHKSVPPIVPQDLNEKQILVLKVLLWSGIHLLTTTYEKFPKLYVEFCKANADASALTCILKNPKQQHIILNVNNTKVPQYCEGINIISEFEKGEIKFSSPYILGGFTKGRIIKVGENTAVKEEIIENYESAFLVMWRHVFMVLEGKKKNFSLDIAIKVEELAKNIAKACT